MNTFIEERLNTNKTPFHAPLKTIKLPTMTVSENKSKSSTKAKAKVTQSDRELFGKLLVVLKERDVDFRSDMKYELSPVPLALVNIDGSLGKTDKASAMQDMQSMVLCFDLLPVDILKPNRAIIIDYMTIVYQIPNSSSSQRKFREVVDNLVSCILAAFSEGDIVHVVADRYDIKESIKSNERVKRHSMKQCPEMKITAREQLLPKNFHHFLAQAANKGSFNKLVFSEMLKTSGRPKAGQSLILAGGFKNHKRVVGVTMNHTIELPHLFSTQEESITRMFLHDACSRQKVTKVVLWSDDTDFMIVGINMSNSLRAELFMRTGTIKTHKFIPFHKIAEVLSSDICALLLAYHALTGCNSTSALRGQGKKRHLT